MKSDCLHLITAICSFIVGILFAISWKCYRISNVSTDFVSYSDQSEKKYILKPKLIKASNNHFMQLNSSIICLVLAKTRKSTSAVDSTWSQRCNHTIFIGSFVHTRIPIIKVNSSATHTSICNAFFHIRDKYKHFDWLMIAKDDTFVLLENLRYFVSKLNPNDIYYLGRPVRTYNFPNYNSPDSGIVLSFGAINLFLDIITNKSNCAQFNLANIGPISRKFEISLAIIFSSKGFNVSDTLDENSRARFLAFQLEKHLLPNQISSLDVYWRTNIFKTSIGMDCCSNYVITLPKLSVLKIHLYNYILYNMKIM